MTTAPIDPLAVAASEKPLLSAVGADFRDRFDGQLEYHWSKNRFLLFYNTKYDVYVPAGEHHPRTRFSVAHELGHYFIEAHRAFLRRTGKSHPSRGEFLSDRTIETEADAFAAGLLMPASLLGPIVNEGEMSFADIERWAGEFKTSVTSTARRAVELSDFPCALIGVREGRVAYSFHSQAMIEGGCYPRPRGSDLPPDAQSKVQAFVGGNLWDDKGQAFARDWCQTYDNDRAAEAPVYEYYCGVPSMQTLLVLLTVPEEEIFLDEDD
ncbi:MAG: ImmA/IrrE family metallo-endopeptidase [Planctomycetes bacterium]|nr:ImmA/IrrE family metallo-endopeptidase [Planctomycetota bacterium]